MVHHPSTIKKLHEKGNSKIDRGGNFGGPKTFGRRIAKWFDDRQITQNSDLAAQFSKLEEEMAELKSSFRDVNWQGDEEIDTVEFKDGVGDCAVVLAGMAHMAGMTFEQCCERAWNEIKDRTGHLNEDGIFVKDE